MTYSHDSTVCGRTYRALKRNNTSWGQPDSSYWFARSEGGKIYFTEYPSCADTGSLFYDFNLMPGDTFRFLNGPGISFVHTVQSVGNIDVGGSRRKKIKFSPYRVWIDGIGDSIRGLYHPTVGWEGAQYKLVCQFDSSGWVFGNYWDPFTNDPLANSHI